MTLKWKSKYLPPSGSIRTAEEPKQEARSVEDEENVETLQEQEEAATQVSVSTITEDVIV